MLSATLRPPCTILSRLPRWFGRWSWLSWRTPTARQPTFARLAPDPPRFLLPHIYQIFVLVARSPERGSFSRVRGFRHLACCGASHPSFPLPVVGRRCREGPCPGRFFVAFLRAPPSCRPSPSSLPPLHTPRNRRGKRYKSPREGSDFCGDIATTSSFAGAVSGSLLPIIRSGPPASFPSRWVDAKSR